MERVILHCDMNNFYASVECMLNPELRDKAVVVGGSVEERHGIVLAKNYKAKAYGIQTGEAIWQARQKCRDIVVVPPNYEQYLKYSRMAQEIYSRYTDCVEPYGMDECWLDVTGSGFIGTGKEIAEAIRYSTKVELGLTVSIGLSFNKIFAKLGSDMKKPDAITCICRHDFKEKVWPLPTRELLGVGSATEAKLHSRGVFTLGELAAMPENLLKKWLGVHGVKLGMYARGLDNSPVMKHTDSYPIKSIGNGTTTVKDLQNSDEVWRLILSLVQSLGTKLRGHRKKAGGISVTVKNNELRSKEWQRKLEAPTQSSTHLAREAFSLFERSYNWQNPIRAVTVRVIDLVDENIPIQYDIFTDTKKLERRERLDIAVERIRERYGRTAVQNGILLAGAHIPTNASVELIMPSAFR